MKFTKVLIANRGEIACRIIKTLKNMGIHSIAVYSEADRFSPHVLMADEAYYLGPAPATQSYLHIEKIIEVTKLAQGDAIHPGYGFLSENPDFALACEQQHIKFIGPHSSTIRQLASKQQAKTLLQTTGVPLIPGFNPPNPSDQELFAAAETIGWPVVLKAAHGGGGKGLKIANSAQDFPQAIQAARREALTYFNNDELLLEKLILSPRHLEVQILADQHGHIIHLFERDCSVQRRHQKIIEEAPAINLATDVRQKLYQYAIEVAQACHYSNAGTVEFLLDQEQHLYFMEVNARLQVEHPITECITGIDLVEWQIKIAQDEPLTIEQPKHPQGHAIECRICAEQAQHDFKPSQGEIQQLIWPPITSKHRRLDTGITAHQYISSYYDSLLAKMIVWEPNRMQAITNMQDFLKSSHILGIETNLEYLQVLLQQPIWQQGAVPIDFLSKTLHPAKNFEPLPILAVMDSIHFWTHNSLPIQLVNLSLNEPRFSPRQYQIQEQDLDFYIHYLQPGQLLFKSTQQAPQKMIHYQVDMPYVWIDVAKQQLRFTIEFLEHEWRIHNSENFIRVFHRKKSTATHSPSKNTEITAPIPATIVAILKNKGDTIKQGEPVLILEAMKMEHTIYAPYDGTLTQYFYHLGQQVNEGQQLFELSPS